MSLLTLSFGAIFGIVFCISIILFAVKKHVPAIVLLVFAIVGAFALWKGSAMYDYSYRGKTTVNYGRLNRVGVSDEDTYWAE